MTTMTTRNPATHFILRIVCVLALVSVFGGEVFSAPKPKTVGDYFLLVPEKYFSYDLAFRRDLLSGKSRGAVVDLRNGYISWDASDAPDAFEFVLFKKANGQPVLAYNDLGDDFDQDDGPDLILLTCDGGKWRDVTNALLPVPLERKLGYRLPREGKSIEVTDGQGRRLYNLTWSKDRFHLKRAATP